MEKKADEETTPTEKQLRTGGDMSPRGRTVLHVRAPEKVERREQLLFIVWIGGGGGRRKGVDGGRVGGSWRESHGFFGGGTDGRSVVANRSVRQQFKRWTIGGDHQNTTKPEGRTDPLISSHPPPLPFHGYKQIRPLNQHCQRKSSIALETIKLCDKIPFLSTKYFKVGNDNLFLQ